MNDSFPLSCTLISPVADPENYELVENSLLVDTSSWSDDRYGLDELQDDSQKP
jgi:hypothetical protein